MTAEPAAKVRKPKSPLLSLFPVPPTYPITSGGLDKAQGVRDFNGRMRLRTHSNASSNSIMIFIPICSSDFISLFDGVMIVKRGEDDPFQSIQS